MASKRLSVLEECSHYLGDDSVLEEGNYSDEDTANALKTALKNGIRTEAQFMKMKIDPKACETVDGMVILNAQYDLLEKVTGQPLPYVEGVKKLNAIFGFPGDTNKLKGYISYKLAYNLYYMSLTKYPLKEKKSVDLEADEQAMFVWFKKNQSGYSVYAHLALVAFPKADKKPVDGQYRIIDWFEIDDDKFTVDERKGSIFVTSRYASKLWTEFYLK